MVPRFTVSIDGIPEFDRGFSRIEQAITDFRSIWPNVAKEFYAIEAGQFGSEGAKGASGKWAALSPAYAKYKAKAFPSGAVLRATGSLFDSLTSPDGAASIFRLEQDEMVLGSKHEGAIYHQRGTARMPARPPISLTEEDKRRIQKSIQLGLVDIIRRSGFSVN